MNVRALALASAVLLVSCSKITQENFAQVRDGMSEQEVFAILGSPTESSTTSVLAISGTSSKWVGGDAVITIRFVNGKVALKSFDKLPAK